MSFHHKSTTATALFSCKFVYCTVTMNDSAVFSPLLTCRMKYTLLTCRVTYKLLTWRLTYTVNSSMSTAFSGSRLRLNPVPRYGHRTPFADSSSNLTPRDKSLYTIHDFYSSLSLAYKDFKRWFRQLERHFEDLF